MLDIDPAIDQSRVDFALWNSTVVPIHDRLSRPYPLPTLKITATSSGFTGASCGQITLAASAYPSAPSDLSDLFYRALTHEYGHAKRCPLLYWETGAGQLVGMIDEGEAESQGDAVYRELARTYPSIPLQTKSLIGKTFNNRPAAAAGGAMDFYRIAGNVYDPSAFAFEHVLPRLPGHDFSSFYRQLGGPPFTLGRYLQALDASVSGKIDGRLPSTNFLKAPCSFLNGPDGTFFAVSAFRVLGSHGGSGVTRSVINPDRVQFVHFARSGGVQQPLPISNLSFTISNGTGRRVQETFDLPVEGVSLEASLPSVDAAEIASWGNGAYRAEGCVRNGGACDPQQSEFSYIIVYHGPDTHGKMFLITTGPDYNQLQPESAIMLTLPPGATAEYYPNLIAVDGTEGDVLATDGLRNRVFTLNGDVSIVNYFVDRWQPYLYAVSNAASFNSEGATAGPNTVVPGSIVSLFSWGATDRDPEAVQAFDADGGLPTELCKDGIERTKIIFTRPDGSELEAPLFYCSQIQVNVQVPFELAGWTEATVAIDLNGKKSNAVRVSVAEADPGIFKIFDSRGFGAVTHADWTLVDEQRPAAAGEVLSLYATGMGAVTPAFAASGKPAPLAPPYATLDRPVVSIAGVPCDVSFTGLAPGFVGLYQVNFKLPAGLPSGAQQLTLRINGVNSNAVRLFLH